MIARNGSLSVYGMGSYAAGQCPQMLTDERSKMVILGKIGLDWRAGGETKRFVRDVRVGRAPISAGQNFV